MRSFSKTTSTGRGKRGSLPLGRRGGGGCVCASRLITRPGDQFKTQPNYGYPQLQRIAAVALQQGQIGASWLDQTANAACCTLLMACCMLPCNTDRFQSTLTTPCAQPQLTFKPCKHKQQKVQSTKINNNNSSSSSSSSSSSNIYRKHSSNVLGAEREGAMFRLALASFLIWPRRVASPALKLKTGL